MTTEEYVDKLKTIIANKPPFIGPILELTPEQLAAKAEKERIEELDRQSTDLLDKLFFVFAGAHYPMVKRLRKDTVSQELMQRVLQLMLETK